MKVGGHLSLIILVGASVSTPRGCQAASVDDANNVVLLQAKLEMQHQTDVMATLVDTTGASEMNAPCGRLESVNMVVPATHLPDLESFYTNMLGMTRVARSAPAYIRHKTTGIQYTSYAFSGSPESCEITFLAGPTAQRMGKGGPGDAYWKIGLALEDVDESGRLYKKKGGDWGGASQFQDVGYLGQTADPSGFAIEFLQTTFENNTKLRSQRKMAAGMDGPANTLGPLGQQQDPVVGQITTRMSDVNATNRFYVDKLGMKLLCIEPVTDHEFDLYFYAFTNEVPPVPDELQHVKNREWLYQRPYTTLEIQHRHDQAPGKLEGTDLQDGAGGFDSISVCLPLETYAKIKDELDEDAIIRDPAGIKVRVFQCK